jgi:hypothetical protein
VRVHHYKRRLEDFERLYPWLVSGKAPEIAFWTTPAG